MPAAAQRPDTARLLRCEIIVKLRPQAAQEIAHGGADRRSTIPQKLEQLQSRYRVRETKPLMMDLERQQGGLQMLRGRGRTLTLRQRRSHATGDVPDLSGIYRIRMDTAGMAKFRTC